MNFRVGITFDLYDDYLVQGYSELEIAEFDSNETIDGLERSLIKLGFLTERIGNAKDLMRALNEGRRWDLVFNICEGLHGTGREALVPAILDCYEIPYTFSDPLPLTLSLHKDMAKRVMCSAGIPTAPFTLVVAEDDIDSVILSYPLFCKPVCEGTSKGIDASCYVETPADLRRTCTHLLQSCQQPVLVESYLPGREFTVGIIGNRAQARVIGGMEIVMREGAEPYGYTYRNKQQWQTAVEFRSIGPEILAACAKAALPAWRALFCRDAGRVDLREDGNGNVHVLEVNPLSGLNENSDLSILARLSKIEYPRLIEMIMNAAIERLQLTAPEAGTAVQPASASA